MLDTTAPTKRMIHVLDTHAFGVVRDNLTLLLKLSVVLVAPSLSVNDDVVVADVSEDHFVSVSFSFMCLRSILLIRYKLNVNQILMNSNLMNN